MWVRLLLLACALAIACIYAVSASRCNALGAARLSLLSSVLPAVSTLLRWRSPVAGQITRHDIRAIPFSPHAAWRKAYKRTASAYAITAAKHAGSWTRRTGCAARRDAARFSPVGGSWIPWWLAQQRYRAIFAVLAFFGMPLSGRQRTRA